MAFTTFPNPGPDRLGHRPTPARFRRADHARPRTRSRRWSRLARRVVPSVAASTDAAAILLATAAVSLPYEGEFLAANDMTFGVLIAGLFVAATAARKQYGLSSYLDTKRQVRAVAGAWCIAFVAAVTVLFMTKTGDFFSRGAAVLIFAAGLGSVLATRRAMTAILTQRARLGHLASRTVFLVGDEASLTDFADRFDLPALGLRRLGASVIRRGTGHAADDLALAAATARMLRPDDIVILAPLSQRAYIARCIDAFMRLPAAIHIGPDPLLEQFADMHIVRNGPLASIHLLRSPLSNAEVALKRGFDLVMATAALVALLPLMALTAVAIRLDSRGPVLFRQTRYGYNREPFRIFKFRTMTTMEDGGAVRQAVRGDKRITRVGAWLRRTNLDELPQLVNVILGDMSLVGPRPHAMAHDQAFERSVELYARRHNVRPGITGWAQINGWRGETDTADKIRGRVEHDLFYVDNWSLWLDLVVLVRTVASRRAYLNAH